jgi:LacI family transcriptional regulator
MRDLIRYQVDGLILFPSTAPEKSLDLAHGKALPLVLVDRPTDDNRFDQVMIDNRKVMREASQRLIALGHRRLLFVCRWRGRPVSRHRIEGLKAAQRAATAPIATTIVEVRDDEAHFKQALTAALGAANPPTVIVASDSHQASLVLGVLRACNVACPEQVSVLTFDDPEWARLVEPTLSVIRQPALAIAQAAWDLLMRRVADEDLPPRAIALEAEIEFRQSVAAPLPAGGAKSSSAARSQRGRAG